MQIKLFKNTVILCALSSFSLSAQAYNLEDTFEKGNMNMTNAEGFGWEGMNKTSLVSRYTAEGNVLKCNPTADKAGACPLYEINTYPGRDWAAKSSETALRFRYVAGDDSFAEQRFHMGSADLADMWVGYWLRVPTNYSAYYNPNRAKNSKVIALWMDGYLAHGTGVTVVANMWSKSDNTSTLGISATYHDGTNNVSAGDLGGKVPNFMTVADRGKWMHIVFRVKAETSPGASDGLIEVWRKWEGDGSYSQLYKSTGLANRLPPGGSKSGFNGGYLMGWSNPGYTAAETEFLIDDFVISDQSLLTASQDPKAPGGFTGQKVAE